MLTNQLKKYVTALHKQKYRQKYNKFIAEGPKICAEFISENPQKIEFIFCTQEWLEENEENVAHLKGKTHVLNAQSLKSISLQKNPNNILIVAEPKTYRNIKIDPDKYWYIYLDKIQDPGNMGTIMRLVDWFGVDALIFSSDSVDIYNSKVIQSAMGAHNRIDCLEMTPEELVKEFADKLYVLSLDGSDIRNEKASSGILVVGNESQGIRRLIQDNGKYKVKIERKGGAESLNAAVACGIACYHFIK